MKTDRLVLEREGRVGWRQRAEGMCDKVTKDQSEAPGVAIWLKRPVDDDSRHGRYQEYE